MPYGGAQFGRRDYVGGAMPGMSGIQPVRPTYVLPQVTVPNATVGPRPPNISKAQGKSTATGGGESRGGQQQAGQQPSTSAAAADAKPEKVERSEEVGIDASLKKFNAAQKEKEKSKDEEKDD